VQDRGPGPALTVPRSGRRVWIIAVAAVLTIIIDQATKAWAVAALEDGHTIDVLWTLRLRLVQNRGAAFGIGDGFAPFFALAAVVVVVFLLRTGRSIRAWPTLLALGLLVGGALGNLLDRFFREGRGFLGGAVIDFVDVQWWPVFNVADAAIVIGSLLLALTAAREPS